MNQTNIKAHKSLLFFILAVFLILGILLFRFHGNKETGPASPFSDAVWQDTPENIIALEGDGYTTYDSVYGGTCYTYPHDYEDRQGTIKYMFNEEEHLMCVAWACAADEEQELYDLYHTIDESVNEKTTDEPDTTDKVSNTGHVWYRTEGNIILSLMITSDLKVLQYSYLHPDVSSTPNA